MEKLEEKDFSVLEWRPARAVDLRFWASALTSLDEAIRASLASAPHLQLFSSSSSSSPSSPAEPFIARCLVFFKNLLDMGFFRQYSFLGSLVLVLQCRSAKLVVLTLEVFQSLTGSAEWQFDHRTVFRRRPAPPYASKTSGESEKDWNMEEHHTKFEFLLDWASEPVPVSDSEEEEDEEEDAFYAQLDQHALQEYDALAAATTMASAWEKQAPGALHRARAKRSRKYALRVQLLLFCLFAPSRTFRKRIKVRLEDAFSVVFDNGKEARRPRASELVAASKVIRAELQNTPASSSSSASSPPPPPSSSSVFAMLVLPFASQGGCLIDAVKHMLSEASAGPEMRLGLSFARVAMRSDSEHFLLRLETLLVMVLACVNKHPGEGLHALISGGVYESLFAWVQSVLLPSNTAAPPRSGGGVSEEEYFALAAALQLFEIFSAAAVTGAGAGEEEEDPVRAETEALIAACSNLTENSVLSFAQRNVLCSLLSLLCNAPGVCCASEQCAQMLAGVLSSSSSPPQHRFGGSAVLYACELVHECAAWAKIQLQHHQQQQRRARGAGQTPPPPQPPPQLHASIVSAVRLFAQSGCVRDGPAEYESVLAVGKYLLPLLQAWDRTAEGSTTTTTTVSADVTSFFRSFFSLYQKEADSRWYPALFFGGTSIGQHLSVFISSASSSSSAAARVGTAAASPSSPLSELVMDMWSGEEVELPPLGMFLSVRLLGELCHSGVFALTFVQRDGLRHLLRRTTDRSSTVVKIIQNIAQNWRKEAFDALCELVGAGAGGEEDFLCEMLVLVLSSSSSSSSGRPAATRALSLVSGDACFAALDHLARWEAQQPLLSRHYARLLHILPSFSAPPPALSASALPAAVAAHAKHASDLGRLMESFALSVESIVEQQEQEEVSLERVLSRAYKLMRREKSQGAFLARLSAFGSLQLLVAHVCRALTTRPDLAPTSLGLLQFLTDKQRFAATTTGEEEAMHHALLEVVLDELCAALDHQQQHEQQQQPMFQDAVLVDLVQLVVSRYVQVPFKRHRRGAAAATAAVAEFKPSREVVLALSSTLPDVHGSDVLAAHKLLRTHDHAAITAHLASHPPTSPVSDEDELDYAMWLSMEEEEKKEEEEDKLAKVKQLLLAQCLQITLHRPEVPAVLSPRLPASAASASSVRSPADSVGCVVLITNRTRDTLVVRSPRGQLATCPPQAERFAISSFVGNVLSVHTAAAEGNALLGYLACSYASAHVTVMDKKTPRGGGGRVVHIPLVGDSTEFETNHIHIRRLVSFQRDPLVVRDSALVRVRLINSSAARVGFYHMFPFSHWRETTAGGEELALDQPFVVEARSERVVVRRRNSVWAGQFLPTNEPAGFLLVPHAPPQRQHEQDAEDEEEEMVEVHVTGQGTQALQLPQPKLASLCSLLAQLQAEPWDQTALALVGVNPVLLTALVLHYPPPPAAAPSVQLRDRVLADVVRSFSPQEDNSSSSSIKWDCPLRAKSLLLLTYLKLASSTDDETAAVPLLLRNALVAGSLNMWELEAAFAWWASSSSTTTTPLPVSLAELVPRVLSSGSLSGVRCIQRLVERDDVDVKFRWQSLAYRTFRSFDAPRVPLETFSLRLGSMGGNNNGGADLRGAQAVGDFFQCVQSQLELDVRRTQPPPPPSSAGSAAAMAALLGGSKPTVSVVACAKPVQPRFLPQDEPMEQLLDLLQQAEEGGGGGGGDAAFVLDELAKHVPRVLLHVGRRAALVQGLVGGFCCDQPPAPSASADLAAREDMLVRVLKQLASSVAATSEGEEEDAGRTELASCLVKLVDDSDSSSSSVRVCQLLLLLLNRNPDFLLVCEKRLQLTARVLDRVQRVYTAASTSSSAAKEQDAWLLLLEWLSSRAVREALASTTSDNQPPPPPPYEQQHHHHLSWRDELREMDHAPSAAAVASHARHHHHLLQMHAHHHQQQHQHLHLQPHQLIPEAWFDEEDPFHHALHASLLGGRRGVPHHGFMPQHWGGGGGGDDAGGFLPLLPLSALDVGGGGGMYPPSSSSGAAAARFLVSSGLPDHHDTASAVVGGGGGGGALHRLHQLNHPALVRPFGLGRPVAPHMGRIGARAMFEQEGANARYEALRDLALAAAAAVQETTPEEKEEPTNAAAPE